MRKDDYDEFVMLLDAAYDMIGSGQNKTLSAGAKGLFFKTMAPYSLQQFQSALQSHCLDKVRGRFTPKPADIIEQIEACGSNDGRLGAEEAWAIAIKSQDESETVVWTDEIAQAFSICQTVLDLGDEVGARMAFKESYARLVGQVRSEHKKVNWFASLGWDANKRDAAINRASLTGLIAPPQAKVLLHNHMEPNEEKNSPEGLKMVKDAIAEFAAMKAMQNNIWEGQKIVERESVAQKKRDIANQVAIYEICSNEQ